MILQMNLQMSSPFGSHENLRTPTSPSEASQFPDSRKSSEASTFGKKSFQTFAFSFKA